LNQSKGMETKKTIRMNRKGDLSLLTRSIMAFLSGGTM
jgi:hypothetical protein